MKTIKELQSMSLDELIEHRVDLVDYLDDLHDLIRMTEARIKDLRDPAYNPLDTCDEDTRESDIQFNESDNDDNKKEIRRVEARIKRIGHMIRLQIIRKETTLWDPVDHLTSEWLREAYIEIAKESNDPELLTAVLADVERSRQIKNG